MSINENAELDPSQVEDMRGAGGGRGGGGFNFPPMGGGGGGGGGMGGAGCLAGLLPLLMRSKIGMAVLLIGALCVGFFICTGGGSSLFSGVGGLTPEQQQQQPGPNDVNSTTLAQQCDKSNPNRFDNPACRNLLYINSIQAYWRSAMPQYLGQQYQPATTRFFTGSVNTACGPATAGVGPFYCPGDNHVYIDLSFYDELASRFGADGQFAQPYVLAHEYGHHLQNLLGTSAQVQRESERDPGNANALSVKLELQADCLAGVWAKHATETEDAKGQPIFKSVTQQDIDQALEAAAAIGDDKIMERSGVPVDESKFTHGTAKQRSDWFNTGFRTGDGRQCDTFTKGV